MRIYVDNPSHNFALFVYAAAAVAADHLCGKILFVGEDRSLDHLYKLYSVDYPNECRAEIMANCSSYTLPAYLWTVFSTLTAIICPMGLYYSNWLQRTTPEGTYNSLSSYRLCLNETSQVSTSCQAYFSFNEIYSSEWKAITLLMGIGACCLIFVGVMSLFGLCIRKLFNIYVTILVVLLQSLGGRIIFSLVATVVIYNDRG